MLSHLSASAPDPFSGQATNHGETTSPIAGAAATQPPYPTPERAQVLLERAVAIFSRTLGEVPQGRDYLRAHGITDAALWNRHRVGYSDGRLPSMLPGEGAILEELTALGLLRADGRERFMGCLVFPIFDAHGRIVTLQALRLEVSSRASRKPHRGLSLPSREGGLWNITAAKTHSRLILVASVLDALSAIMAGHLNVVSVEGSLGLRPDDAAALSEHRLEQVILPYSDTMESVSANRVALLLPDVRCVRLRLPDGQSLNSLLRAGGIAAVSSALNHSTTPHPFGDWGESQQLPDGFAVMIGRRRYEIRGLERSPRQLRATLRVEHAGKAHIDTLDFYSARWRRALAQDLSRVFADSADTVDADIAKLIALCEDWKPAPPSAARPVGATMTDSARTEAEAFGKDPLLVENILGDFKRCGLEDERASAMLVYLASVSRKTIHPLSLLIHSDAGGSRTGLVDTTAAFCPPEDLVRLTHFSVSDLWHRESTSLKHKLLVITDSKLTRETLAALLHFTGSGELVTETTHRNPRTGQITRTQHRVEGPTALLLATRETRIDPETRSLFFAISLDESREKTEAILRSQRHGHTLAALEAESDLCALRQKHQNFQRLLRPLRVVNPYADQVTYGEERVHSRWEQPRYLDLISSVAFLRQMQKPSKTTADGTHQYVEVDRTDIRLANDLMTQLLGHSHEELSHPAHELLGRLASMPQPASEGKIPNRQAQLRSEVGSFTRRQIRELTGWSQARLHRCLTELVEFEFLEVMNGRNGVQHRFRLPANGGPERLALLGLQAPEALREPESSPQGNSFTN